MNDPRRILAAVLAAGCLAAADAPAPLTLPEAVRLAGERNETAEIARARLDRAAASRRQSLAALLPSVSAGVSASRTSTGYRPFDASPVPAAGERAGMSVTLIDPAAWLALDAARIAASADELDAGELRRALAFSAASAFLDAWAADRRLEAARRRLAVARRTVEEGRARVAAGVATASSLARNELELASARTAEISAALAVTTTRLALADLLVDEAPAALADPPAAAVPEGDLEALAEAARHQRADLRAAGLRVDAWRASANRYRAGYLPTVSASGTVSAADGSSGAWASSQPAWTGTLSAAWTLYDGGAGSAAADAADAQRREAAASLRAAHRGLATSLAQARAALASAEAGSAQAGQQVEVARLNLAEVDGRAAQGLATGLQAADANAALYEAEQALTVARLSLESARYRLRQLVGWWPLTGPAQPAPAR